MLFQIIKSNKKNTFRLFLNIFKKTDIFGPIFSSTSFNGYLNTIFCTRCRFNQFLLSAFFLSQNHTLRSILLTRHPNPGSLTPKSSPHPTTSYNNPALSATEVIRCLFTVRSIGAKAELGQSLCRGWSIMVLRKISIRWNGLQGNLEFLDTNVGEESSKSFLSSLKLFLKQGQK